MILCKLSEVGKPSSCATKKKRSRGDYCLFWGSGGVGGISGGVLGGLGDPEGSSAGLGRILVGLGGVLGDFGGILKGHGLSSWDLGFRWVVFWGGLGRILGDLDGVLGGFGKVLGDLGGSWKILGEMSKVSTYDKYSF